MNNQACLQIYDWTEAARKVHLIVFHCSHRCSCAFQLDLHCNCSYRPLTYFTVAPFISNWLLFFCRLLWQAIAFLIIITVRVNIFLILLLFLDLRGTIGWSFNNVLIYFMKLNEIMLVSLSFKNSLKKGRIFTLFLKKKLSVSFFLSLREPNPFFFSGGLIPFQVQNLLTRGVISSIF